MNCVKCGGTQGTEACGPEVGYAAIRGRWWCGKCVRSLSEAFWAEWEIARDFSPGREYAPLGGLVVRRRLVPGLVVPPPVRCVALVPAGFWSCPIPFPKAHQRADWSEWEYQVGGPRSLAEREATYDGFFRI